MEQVRSGAGYKFCFFSGTTVGVIMGMAMLMLVTGYRLDYYQERTAYLESTITDKEERLKMLEQTINTQHLILEDIEIILAFTGSDLDKIVLEKSIHKKYTVLLGKEVESIDADLAAEVIDNRILKIKEREYKIHVSKLILTDVLKIWAEAVPIE